MADPPLVIETNAAEVAHWLRGRLDEFPKAMREAAKEIEREALRNLRRTASTWHHHPDFEAVTEMDGGSFELMAGTDDPVWNMLDVGTQPHYIFPVRARALAFPSGYKAKTMPGVLDAKGGGPFGETMFRAWVEHPGTAPRKWDEKLAEVLRQLIPDVVRRQIERWGR